MSILDNSFNLKVEGTQPNLLCKSSITLISKPDKEKNYLLSLMIDHKYEMLKALLAKSI